VSSPGERRGGRAATPLAAAGLALAQLWLAAGCGPATPPAGPARGGAAHGQPAAGERSATVVASRAGAPGAPARVVGRVRFDGPPPERAPIGPALRTTGCTHDGRAPLGEDVVVGEDGGLADVLLALVDPGPAPPELDPSGPLEIDQRACTFVPHLVALRTGQAVRVANGDATAHNVRLVAERNPTVNRTIAAGGPPVELRLERAERARLACDLHPWMSAWLCALEHPWFAVSAADGSFHIGDVPSGEQRLEAWHPILGTLVSPPFQVEPGATVELRLTFALP